MKNKHTTWQEMMDEAFERWENGDLVDVGYPDFVASLPPSSQRAVVLGSLNYQVQNGGFSQWVGNGYGTTAPSLIKFLGEMNTVSSLKAKSFVEQLLPFINVDAKNRGAFGDYWNTEIVTETNIVDCSSCGGDGILSDDETECADCDGYGGVEEEFEDTYCEGEEIAERLDDEFYKINEQFMDDVENWLEEIKEANYNNDAFVAGS